MQDIHYACNNTQVCTKRVLPDAECKKEGCKFCIETEIYVVNKETKMANSKIKQIAKNYKVKLWQIADKLGMQDSNFSKMLRKQLSIQDENKIIGIIQELKGGVQ